VLYSFVRPFLFGLDAERAHGLSLCALEAAYRSGALGAIVGRLPETPVAAMGLSFPNPLGLAAGLDKDAAHVDALGALGFGFLEVGGVTPRAQPGNPKPRVFRLPEAKGIINRLGFNSAGVEAFAANIARARYRGIVGVNLGKNKDTPLDRAHEDYIASLERIYPLVAFATVNVSSPNTKDLRKLQGADELAALLARMHAARERLADQHGKRLPLAFKIAPDVADDAIDAIARIGLESGMDAIIATNTTVARDAVAHLAHGREAGGLSGGPVRERSTQVIRRLARALDGALPIIGVGGIMSTADALEKLDAGATLVQLYTGLVYEGPELVGEIVRGIAAARDARPSTLAAGSTA
jgi:dihydroorotate dehydrogenase